MQHPGAKSSNATQPFHGTCACPRVLTDDATTIYTSLAIER